jgi:hypothetical protein
MEKGQVTIETLIILGASTLMLLMFVTFAWDQMIVSYNAQQTDIAKATLSRLADEIDDAYYLGVGTKKTFELVLPDAAKLSESIMIGRTILLNVGGNDVIVNTNVDINGEWPEITGKTTFEIEVEEGLVQIRVNPR